MVSTIFGRQASQPRSASYARMSDLFWAMCLPEKRLNEVMSLFIVRSTWTTLLARMLEVRIPATTHKVTRTFIIHFIPFPPLASAHVLFPLLTPLAEFNKRMADGTGDRDQNSGQRSKSAFWIFLGDVGVLEEDLSHSTTRPQRNSHVRSELFENQSVSCVSELCIWLGKRSSIVIPQPLHHNHVTNAAWSCLCWVGYRFNSVCTLLGMERVP